MKVILIQGLEPILQNLLLSQYTNFRNKIECLSLASIYSLV